MATERQAPDTVPASTNLSGGVTDIDEDPDSPDGNWMVASGNNVNTDVRVTFPTPTGNPTVGADLQEFKAWVRQFNTEQTGDPDARIELWENGTLVRAGSDVSITGSGQMVTFPWNANELATADGSLVEMKVVGTKSGGSPGARNTVDVGAVEWNVDYTTGTYYDERGRTMTALAVTSENDTLQFVESPATQVVLAITSEDDALRFVESPATSIVLAITSQNEVLRFVESTPASIVLAITSMNDLQRMKELNLLTIVLAITSGIDTLKFVETGLLTIVLAITTATDVMKLQELGLITAVLVITSEGDVLRFVETPSASIVNAITSEVEVHNMKELNKLTAVLIITSENDAYNAAGGVESQAAAGLLLGSQWQS